MVFTTRGLLPLSVLEVADIPSVHKSGRQVVTEYRYQGELVRRSAWFDLWQPMQLEAK